MKHKHQLQQSIYIHVASSSSISLVILLQQFDNTDTIAKNTVGQRNAIAKIKKTTQRVFEYEQAIRTISDQNLKDKLSVKIEVDHVIIKVNKKRLGKLKCHRSSS
ncbi:6732_t:CDS:2 [Dentiscutata heterogama]|uniref:6732_t:CDS:1 n=1 Tax=Dentiscutata heterogama TaxID=1316150 RepID=A0ACA9KJW0_9GLOM|nr:6732_t:CDS:2 [Dentiscutata heterogama]